MSEIETLSLLFDSAWYLATYQDVTIANCDPLEHYLVFGYKEGRNPNRFFNTNFYLKTYRDLASSQLNPFIHYILYGASEGRLPRAPHQDPLPAITFDIFLEEDNKDNTIEIKELETEHIKTKPSKAVKNGVKKGKETVEEKSVATSSNKEDADTIIKPIPKKNIRKPVPKIKTTALAQKRKK